MEARTKTIEEWFSSIQQGLVTLPRFQRFEAWDRGRIQGVLENVLRSPSLPIGALLVLAVGDEELFHSRPISGAPDTASRPSTHLLDGQQRMTALWRTLKNNYEDLAIFVSIESDDQPDVQIHRRWERKGVKHPVWAHDARQAFERNLLPIQTLCPGSAGETIAKEWFKTVVADSDLQWKVMNLRQRVATYKIPFLELPVGTEPDTALDVFINMNTSASPLKDFDIVVAQLEGAVGDSLHTMMEELHERTPELKNFNKPEDLALSVGALLLGRPPLKKTYLGKSFGADLSGVWDSVVSGIQRGIDFLQEECIFGDYLVPTDVAVYLCCALWGASSRLNSDDEGRARTIIRKTLWSACFTDRYLKTAATRAYADFTSISSGILNRNSAVSSDLFDRAEYPLPSVEELAKAGWPTKRDRLARSIVAVSLKAGGYDFADGAKASAQNIRDREFHHLFPVAVLGQDRTNREVSRALNCALISWRTNRRIAANTPADYIRTRAAEAELGDTEVEFRLHSHLVPYEELIIGDYAGFLERRANIISKAMIRVCDGHTDVSYQGLVDSDNHKS